MRRKASKPTKHIFSLSETTCSDPMDSDVSVFWYVLMSGSFLCGISASTILTVGISYIDDSLPVTSSPLYTGELAINLFVNPCPADF